MSRYWTLWHRHLFRQILLQTLFLLVFLLAMYTFVDASINLSELKKLGSLKRISAHYIIIFIKRTPQILPFALLLTSVKTFVKMQKNHELISLRMSGASKLSILMPFLVAALFASSLNFSLNEGLFARPVEMKSVNFNPVGWLSNNWKFSRQEPLEAIPLDEKLDSWLVFYQYIPEKKEFTDVFWIKNEREWWHFNKLILSDQATGSSTAFEADCFELQENGKRLWRGHFENLNLDMSIEDSQLVKNVKPAQELNVFELYRSLKESHPKIQEPKLIGYLYFRLFQPMLCLLAPLAAASVTLRYSRNVPSLMSYILSGSILAMTLMLQQSGLLIATSGRVHPIFSIGAVTVVIFMLTGYAVKKT